jgi:iron complex outermembrane recepter protein
MSNMTQHNASTLSLLTLSLAMLFNAMASAQTIDTSSLEDLMRVEVTSVSKKPQKLANVSGSVFVITAEDIKLSGAHSIPEALQMAPGLSVVRLNGNRWGVNSRGYADRFANRLLVMVDGRNAFNPAFNGVFWENFQFPLEDIARIEVIRGPASSVWGPNGVVGAINIITKSASSTQGARAVVGYGNSEGVYGRASFGGRANDERFFFRGYVSAQDAPDQMGLFKRPANDASKHQGAGFRMDGYLADGGRWDLSGDFLTRSANGGSDYLLPTYVPPPGEDHQSHALRGRYQKTLADNSEIQVQSALAYTDLRIGAISDVRTTFDLDAQHRTRLFSNHDLVWGVNYRFSTDEIASSPILSVTQPSRSIHQIGAFAQDEIAIVDTLKLSLGLRLDHSKLASLAVQPSAGVTWNVAPSQTLWARASRADRAPSRGETGLALNIATGLIPSPTGVPALPALIPVISSIKASPNFSAERLDALELGWRATWTAALSTDVTLFYHDLSKMRNVTDVLPVVPVPGPAPGSLSAIIGRGIIDNSGALETAGVELSADWRIDPTLRLQIATTFTDTINFRNSDGAARVPKLNASVRLAWSPSRMWNADLWLRHMSGRGALTDDIRTQRIATNTLDARLGWRFHKAWELAVTGKNLTDSACEVYRNTGLVALEANNIVPTCFGRAYAVEVRGEM